MSNDSLNVEKESFRLCVEKEHKNNDPFLESEIIKFPFRAYLTDLLGLWGNRALHHSQARVIEDSLGRVNGFRFVTIQLLNKLGLLDGLIGGDIKQGEEGTRCGRSVESRLIKYSQRKGKEVFLQDSIDTSSISSADLDGSIRPSSESPSTYVFMNPKNFDLDIKNQSGTKYIGIGSLSMSNELSRESERISGQECNVDIQSKESERISGQEFRDAIKPKY